MFISRLNQLTIAQKIVLGHVVSIGIAIFGTTAGLVAGGVFKERAINEYQAARTEVELVAVLGKRIQRLMLHPAKLLASSSEPLWLRYEIGQYPSDVAQLHRVLADLQQLLASDPAIVSKEKARLLEEVPQLIDSFTAWNEAQWSVLNDAPRQFEEELIARMTSPEWRSLQLDFQRLSEDLVHLQNQADFRSETALIQWEQARNFRFWAVAFSMSGATFLAVLLAFYISRTIASPISNLTEVTKCITETNDFDQRVVVTTEDETAQLAESIDRLVMWVKQYTGELQEARDTLEERVEERTRTLQKTQSQLVQSEKMSSLGQLVAGIAHEINNPINFIYGNIPPASEYVSDVLALIELYREYYPEPEAEIAEKILDIDLEFIEDDLPNILMSMTKGVNRIKEIVLSLRTFSRLDEASLKEADLHAGLESTLMILQHRLKEQPDRAEIPVAREFGDLPLVYCFAGPLNQVFMNLLSNAIDALEDNLKVHDFSEPKILVSTKIIQDHCVVTIQNNGPPIPQEIQGHIFDPFFTTKEVGKGTGMGLSISYQIVTEKHGGTLVCHSNEKEGTSFIVSIPLVLNKVV